MPVRRREDSDVEPCVDLMREIHELDGYPTRLPADVRSFVASDDAYGAWVFVGEGEREGEGSISGHVALHRHSSEAVLALASATLEVPGDQLGVVARLMVAPAARRAGVGRILLDVAAADALHRGLRPILDVATHHHAAIALYERCGWARVGPVTARFRDGSILQEFVYYRPS